MKKKLIILSLLFLCGYIYTQNGIYQNIKGVVLDNDMELPLIGASIIILETNPIVGTISDTDGKFKIENIPIGKIDLQISYVGYHTISISNISLNSAKEAYMEIKLKEKIYNTNEVVIVAHQKDKPVNELAYVSARSFTIEETQRFAGSMGDPSRMAANYAGVTSVSDDRNDIIIRGNSPMGLLWRLEGVDIPNPNHFSIMGTTGGPVSILNNNILSNSDFITGAFPAEYGNSSSGVFDLKMRNGNNEKHEFVFQTGFSGMELGAEGPFSKKSKASYLVNTRYSQIGLMDDIGISPEEIPAIPKYKDVSYKVNIPTKTGRISLFGIGGLSNIEYLESEMEPVEWTYQNSSQDNYLESTMLATGISYVKYFDNNVRLNTVFAYSLAESNSHIDSMGLDNHKYIKRGYKNSESKYSFVSNIKHKINSKNIYNAGVNINLYYLNYNDSIIISRSNYMILNNTKGNMALLESFIQYEYKIARRLTNNFGIHFQYFDFNNTYAFEPRLAFRWNYSDNQHFNIGYGLHHQLQPKPVYLMETMVNGMPVKTNENLDFTRSNHLIGGYNLLINKDLRLIIETYYQALSNIPVLAAEPGFSLVNAGAEFEIPMKSNLVNKGKGENYGIEFTLEQFLNNNFYFLTALSLFQSKYQGYDGIKRDTEFNGNFVYNLLAGYDRKIGNNSFLKCNIKTVYAGGRRYIPILEEESIERGYIVYDWENAYKEKRDNYFKTDLNIFYKLNRLRATHEIGFEFQNITNSKNLFTEYFDPTSGKIKQEYQVGFFAVPTYRLYF